MADNQPLISVIVPCYNGARFLRETLNSVRAQSYTMWEAWIIDDGSTDESPQIIADYVQLDSRFHSYRQENKGVSAARNAGIERLMGEYLSFLDADDVWEPMNLQEKLQALVEQKAEWVYSDAALINEESQDTGEILKGKAGDQFHLLLQWEGDVVPGASNILVKRSFLGNTIRFDEQMSTAADRDFYLQLASKTYGHYLEKVLWKYRMVGESMSHAAGSVLAMEKDQLRMYDKALEGRHDISGSLKRKYRSKNDLILGLSWWKNGGKKLRGLDYIIRSFLRSPQIPLEYWRSRKLNGR